MTLQIKLDSDPAPAGDEPASSAWRTFGSGAMPFELRSMFGDPELRSELDATRKRLDQLERRLDKLERR